MSGVINIMQFSEDKIDFIGSRQVGAKIREKMAQYINKGSGVTLDFGNVSKITQSFGDEIIGVFIRAYGIQYISSNVRLVNENKDITTILNIVATYSSKKTA